MIDPATVKEWRKLSLALRKRRAAPAAEMSDTLQRLLSENDEATRLIRRLEWTAGEEGQCGVCYNDRSQFHTVECPLCHGIGMPEDLRQLAASLASALAAGRQVPAVEVGEAMATLISGYVWREKTLRHLEWMAGAVGSCGACERLRESGHAADCPVGAWLG